MKLADDGDVINLHRPSCKQVTKLSKSLNGGLLRVGIRYENKKPVHEAISTTEAYNQHTNMALKDLYSQYSASWEFESNDTLPAS